MQKYCPDKAVGKLLKKIMTADCANYASLSVPNVSVPGRFAPESGLSGRSGGSRRSRGRPTVATGAGR